MSILEVVYYFLTFIVGMIIGAIVVHFFYKKQIKNFQKQYEKMNKDQVRNMLSAFGKKPSEEQVNKIVQSMKMKNRDTKKVKRKK